MTVESLTTRPSAGRIRLLMLLTALALALAAVLVDALAAPASARAATSAQTTSAQSTSAQSASAQASAPPPPAEDPFYTYSGSTPLSQIAPGTVLNTRTTTFHLAGISLPIKVVQLLYRSTTVQSTPTTNVTSVLIPPLPSATPHLVAYGSFYDSLNRDDEPSYTFAGASYSSGRELPTVETAFLAPLLLAGDTVTVADTEGQQTDFATGPEYGMLTLDGIRAAETSSATGLTTSTKVALMGYSGGAIATGWAAQMAPGYAPDVEGNLVGATMGGVLVEPAHNLNYVSGSQNWAGVMPMALIGVARAYGISFTKYLSAYGRQIVTNMQGDDINTANSDYPGLTFAQLVKPPYANPESIPPFVAVANQLILGHDALPQVPLQIDQGAGGFLDGTSGSQPGIGAGDGVMITGDVRSYAREACAAGDPVDYTQYDLLAHEETAVPWGVQAVTWLAARFAGAAAPSDCSSIAPGNRLDPVTQVPPGS